MGGIDFERSLMARLPPEMRKEFHQAFDFVRNGSIELVIFKGKVVQINKTDKVRVPESHASS